MKILLKSVLILSLFLVLANRLYADLVAIVVSPVRKSLILSKGEEREERFTVYNKSDESQRVNVNTMYWFLVDENKSIPLDSWLKTNTPEFEIGPKERREVIFNVSAPEEAGGELGVKISFRPYPKEGQAINVVFSVSLYLMIKDTERIDCKINDFKLWKFKDRDALGARVALKNDGNVHLKPRINVFIQNIFKSRNLNMVILEYGMPTYPGRIQNYQGAIYNFKLKPGLYRTVIDAEFINVAKRFRRKVYFLVGRDGKVVFTFFRRPKM